MEQSAFLQDEELEAQLSISPPRLGRPPHWPTLGSTSSTHYQAPELPVRQNMSFAGVHAGSTITRTGSELPLPVSAPGREMHREARPSMQAGWLSQPDHKEQDKCIHKCCTQPCVDNGHSLLQPILETPDKHKYSPSSGWQPKQQVQESMYTSESHISASYDPVPHKAASEQYKSDQQMPPPRLKPGGETASKESDGLLAEGWIVAGSILAGQGHAATYALPGQGTTSRAAGDTGRADVPAISSTSNTRPVSPTSCPLPAAGVTHQGAGTPANLSLQADGESISVIEAASSTGSLHDLRTIATDLHSEPSQVCGPAHAILPGQTCRSNALNSGDTGNGLAKVSTVRPLLHEELHQELNTLKLKPRSEMVGMRPAQISSWACAPPHRAHDENQHFAFPPANSP